MTSPVILFYDMETPLNLLYSFSCGKQVIRHNQLVPGYSTWGILCISYCFNDGKKAKSIVWEPETGVKGMVEKFDKIINSADQVIGKNSDRFDNKMLNFQRALEGLPAISKWMKKTDDLEKQTRKFLKMPSQSLDYISEVFGYGGKKKMDFSHWVMIHQYMMVAEFEHLSTSTYESMDLLNTICQRMFKKSLELVIKDGKVALKQMSIYCNKDIEDTRGLWYDLHEHFEPKFDELAPNCKVCGSFNRGKAGFDYTASGAKQRYKCKDCGARIQ